MEFTYELIDNSYYKLIGITPKTDTIIEVPNEYNGKPIQEIAAGVFNGCSNLTTLTIPFTGGSLTKTTLAADTLFGYIFGEVSYTNSYVAKQYYGTSLLNPPFKNYYIPKNLTTINVGGYNLILNTFQNCIYLKEINISDSIVSINVNAFKDCYFNAINVSENNDIYSSLDGNLYLKNKTTLIKYANGKQEETFNIPESVTTIGNQAFSLSSLIRITIPNNITNIRDQAFYKCYSLNEIKLSHSLTVINTETFGNCYNLKNIEITNSITEIQAGAFVNCNINNVYFTGTLSD